MLIDQSFQINTMHSEKPRQNPLFSDQIIHAVITIFEFKPILEILPLGAHLASCKRRFIR